MANEWKRVDHALAYLARADAIPHRTEGEAALIEEVSPDSRRILDLRTGEGRLLPALVLPSTLCRPIMGLFCVGHPFGANTPFKEAKS